MSTHSKRTNERGNKAYAPHNHINHHDGSDNFPQYKALSVTIVKQAIADMEHDLRKCSKHHPWELQTRLEYWRNWFESDWFEFLSGWDGQAIYTQLMDNFLKYDRCLVRDPNQIGSKWMPYDEEDEELPSWEKEEGNDRIETGGRRRKSPSTL